MLVKPVFGTLLFVDTFSYSKWGRAAKANIVFLFPMLPPLVVLEQTEMYSLALITPFFFFNKVVMVGVLILEMKQKAQCSCQLSHSLQYEFAF